MVHLCVYVCVHVYVHICTFLFHFQFHVFLLSAFVPHGDCLASGYIPPPLFESCIRHGVHQAHHLCELASLVTRLE